MMRFSRNIILIVSLFLIAQTVRSEQVEIIILDTQEYSQEFVFSPTDTVRLGQYNIILSDPDTPLKKKRNKLIAIAADLLTGPLGGHRIYLGTEPYVPVVYALTLGGGLGVLPVADLFVIIFTKDLNKYCDNSQIIMWL